MQTENNIEKDSKATVYELSYLLLPSLANEQVPGIAASLKEQLTALGGAIISDENPVLIDLAYSMTKVVQTLRHKATSAYFGWIKFEMEADGMVAAKKALDANDNILRYLIIKTVKENTLLNGKMRLHKEERSQGEGFENTNEEAPEAVKETAPEELDKSIDDLVVA